MGRIRSNVTLDTSAPVTTYNHAVGWEKQYDPDYCVYTVIYDQNLIVSQMTGYSVVLFQATRSCMNMDRVVVFPTDELGQNHRNSSFQKSKSITKYITFSK